MKIYCEECEGTGKSEWFDDTPGFEGYRDCDCSYCLGKGYTEFEYETLLASERSKVIAEVREWAELLTYNVYTDYDVYPTKVINQERLIEKLDLMDKG